MLPDDIISAVDSSPDGPSDRLAESLGISRHKLRHLYTRAKKRRDNPPVDTSPPIGGGLSAARAALAGEPHSAASPAAENVPSDVSSAPPPTFTAEQIADLSLQILGFCVAKAVEKSVSKEIAEKASEFAAQEKALVYTGAKVAEKKLNEYLALAEQYPLATFCLTLFAAGAMRVRALESEQKLLAKALGASPVVTTKQEAPTDPPPISIAKEESRNGALVPGFRLAPNV